jgi:CPA2 family monovalent cation:H+ antiporter-2
MEGIILALVVCLILAVVTKHLSLPTIPFYILAGLVIGQNGLQLVGVDEVSLFLTRLGLIFLLFFLGLSIKPARILESHADILKSGIIDLNINLVIGFIMAYALGFTLFDALIIASAFFISSTAMVVTSLIENKKLLMRESETTVWLMVFEDIVLIVLLALLGASAEHPAYIILKMIFVLGVLVLCAHFGKRYISTILKRDDELPVLLTFTTVLVIAFFSQSIGIPESFMVIAFGTILGTIDSTAFEKNARPFKDVFLVVFFVFFGISVEFVEGISIMAILLFSTIAVVSKLISGLAIGKVIHGTPISGIEIWSNTIARGEFSIAIAALYGSAVVSSTVAAMVIITSIIGAFVAKYSTRIRASILSKKKHPLPEGGE